MLLLSLGIQLCANALIVYKYRHTPGYDQDFSISELALFYTTRPRLIWMPLSILKSYGRNSELRKVRQEGTEIQDTLIDPMRIQRKRNRN